MGVRSRSRPKLGKSQSKAPEWVIDGQHRVAALKSILLGEALKEKGINLYDVPILFAAGAKIGVRGADKKSHVKSSKRQAEGSGQKEEDLNEQTA